MLKPKSKRLISLLIAIALILSIAAPGFAMPNGTIVMGDAAYSLNYAADGDNYAEIISAFQNSDFSLFYKDFSGNWQDGLGNALNAAQVAAIPSVVYKNVGQEAVKYGEGDSDEAQPVTPGEASEVTVSAFDPNTEAAKNEIIGNGLNKLKLKAKVGEKIGVVKFSSTLPTLSQDIVTLQNGEAVIDFTPLVVSAATEVTITVTVIEADFKANVGKSEEITIKVLPITGSGDVITKKIITAVNAEVADRITLYANTKDFAVKDLVAGDFTVINRLKPAEPIAILGFLAHPENPQAVIAILDETSGEFPMTDNAKHELQIDFTWAGRPAMAPAPIFENTKLGEVKFDLVDANHPKVLEVKSTDQLTIEVRYNEPVADNKKGATKTNGDYAAAADFESKYILDGRRVDSIPGAVATVGNATANTVYNVINKDERHIVTIKLPVAYAMSGGNHVLQVEKVGDWASVTDTRNVLKTQTINFNVQVDYGQPIAKLVQHSPEQFLVVFNKVLKAQPEFIIKNAQAVAKSGTKQFTLEEGLLAKNFTVTDVTAHLGFFKEEGKQAYLIELNQDWTVHYNTKADDVNYWSSNVNKHVLYVNDFEDLLGNEVAVQEIPFTIARDSFGPQLVEVHEIPGCTYVVDSLPNQKWKIEIDEPVQIDPLTLPNTTPSEAQAGLGGIPDIEVEFSKGDKQVEGNISSVTIHDFLFDIQPIKALDEAGEWDVEIKGLTDDVGNAQDTLKFPVTIVPKESAVTAPRIDWVNAHVEGATIAGDDYAGYTHIHVKFNNNMMIGGSSYSVERTENWNIDGYDLPEGSSIVKGIPFLPSKATNAITIKVPTAWVEENLGERLVIDYSALKDVSGATLESGRVILTEDGAGNGDYEYVRPNTIPVIAVENHAIYHDGTALLVAKNAPVTSPIASFNKDSAYYMTGHDYNFAGTVNVGIGLNMNVTLEDMIITGDLNVDIGNGCIELDNVDVTGTTTIISAGSNGVVLKASNLGAVVVKDDVKFLMQNNSSAASIDINPGADKVVKLDSDTTTNIAKLTLTSGTVEMRSHSGNLLSVKQIITRVSAVDDKGGKLKGVGDVNADAVIKALEKEPGEVEVADLTAYNAALAGVVEADYTADSWAAYQEVVAANVVTATNTQVEVDAATAAILAAQAGLVESGSGDPGVPGVKDFQAVASLEIGKRLVIVELDTATPENYNVAVAGVQLDYNTTAKKFIGDVPEANAVLENVVVSEKPAAPAMPGVKDFQAVASLEIGKRLVIVELDTATPENYNVAVAGVQLDYNTTAKKFIGDVPEVGAVLENVVVSAK